MKSACIVVMDHSFRINSRIIKTATNNYNNVLVVYPSPWYWSPAERAVLKSGSVQFHREAINHFARDLNDVCGLKLYILKEGEPVKGIARLCADNNVATILYDMPLFGKSSWLDFETVGAPWQVIDSDSHDPDCQKMTAKSRWVYWNKNRKPESFPPPRRVANLNCDLETIDIDASSADAVDEKILATFRRFEQIVPEYGETRNSREGTTRLSKYLHHGLIDANELVSSLLRISPQFMEKEHPLVPIFRQLAFREICIRKARTRDLHLGTHIESWANALLDEKSFKNLFNEFEQSFSTEQLFSGNTGDGMLDREIRLAKEHGWMPNRARMWFAGQCYYGLGGGMKSLEALISFFNTYCDDAQSPNNYVCCTESMRLQYGKVMKMSKTRTNKLLAG